MRNVHECPKGIGLASNLKNFLGEKKNVIDITSFRRIKFSYKLGCTLRLQLHSISVYWMSPIHHWVPFSIHILHACRLSKKSIIMPSINFLNSKFLKFKIMY